MNQVTCVIPVRNGAATIERAIKSAIDAGCGKVIAFDDASFDNTYFTLLDLQDKYSARSLWVYSSLGFKLGAISARNYLISFVETQLIICLDADDTLHDIAPLVAAWEPNTWVYGDHNEVNGETVTRHKGAPAGSLSRKMVTGVTFLFAKEDWQKVGGFDPDFAYAEDYGFQCALTHAGVQPRYVDTVVYDRYVHPEGNERTALASQYWTFYSQMARRKYPSVFAGTG